MNRGGQIHSFPEKYWLKVVGFDLVYSDDLIFEPGEVTCIKNLKVVNCGKMPSPAMQNILATIANTDLIRFDFNDAIPLKRELIEGEVTQLDSDLTYYLKDYDLPTTDTTYMIIAAIDPINIVTRVNKNFGTSLVRKIQIRWPVELSVLIGPRAISREEEGPFSFEIRNISSFDIGKTAPIPRILTVIVQQVSLLKDDKEYVGEQAAAQDQIEFRDEEGNTSMLSDTIVREIVVPANDSIKFSGTFRFADPETPFYTKIRVKASVLLGKRHEVFQDGKLIQCRTFDLQLAESFNMRPKAEFLLVTNSSVNRSEIESWRVFMRKFHTDMMIWNISLYNGFSYKMSLGNMNFAKMLKNKIVVILNNVFKNELNDVNKPMDLIPKKEFFQSAKALGISTLFFGGGLIFGDFVRPNEQILDGAVNSENLYEVLESKWKKEGEDLKKNCKEKEKQDSAENQYTVKNDLNNPLADDFSKDELRPDNIAFAKHEDFKEEDPKNNGYFQVITMKKTFCCGPNLTKDNFVHEILKIKTRLNDLFPNHTYHFFYRMRPKLLKKSMGYCETFELGEVEIRRGIDSDLFVDQSLAHSKKNNNLVDQVDEFLLFSSFIF